MIRRHPPIPAPLTPAVFHILLALADGPLHGYAIMQAVEMSAGEEMGPGTIYGSLGGWLDPATGGQNVPGNISTRLIARACLNCHAQIHGSNAPAAKGRFFLR